MPGHTVNGGPAPAQGQQPLGVGGAQGLHVPVLHDPPARGGPQGEYPGLRLDIGLVAAVPVDMVRGQVRDDGHRRGEHGRPGQLKAAQLQHHGVEVPVREGGRRRPQVSADPDVSPRPSEHVPDQGGHRALSVASRHGDKLPPDMRRDEVQLPDQGNAPPLRALHHLGTGRDPRAQQQGVGLEGPLRMPLPLPVDPAAPEEVRGRSGDRSHLGHKNACPKTPGHQRQLPAADPGPDDRYSLSPQVQAIQVHAI